MFETDCESLQPNGHLAFFLGVRFQLEESPSFGEEDVVGGWGMGDAVGVGGGAEGGVEDAVELGGGGRRGGRVDVKKLSDGTYRERDANEAIP